MPKISIDSDIDLERFLQILFKERFHADRTSSVDGHVHGSLDGEDIFITFWPHEKIVVSGENKKVIGKLVSTINYVMDKHKPLCRYDLIPYEQDEVVCTSLEWNINNPDERIKELVNDRAFLDGTQVVNLALLNGKDLTSYYDTEEEKAEMIKNAKIYGIYKGHLKDEEQIKNLSEADLYLAIQTVEAIIARKKMYQQLPFVHDEMDTTEDEYALDYLIYQTKKFGVKVSEPKFHRRILTSKEYEAWKEFYRRHFDSFSEDQWKTFKELKEQGRDPIEFLPVGDWRDVLKEMEEQERQAQEEQEENPIARILRMLNPENNDDEE